MKVSVAQIGSRKGDIPENIRMHKACIEMAISEKVDFIAFPELSITGYEPELAEELAVDIDDFRLDKFQNISDLNNISIGIGVPVRTESGILISMILFQPDQDRKIYSKQKLHADELPFFIEGHEQLILTVGHAKIAPAICYESLFGAHSENAKTLGADIYLASVAKPENAIEKAYEQYQRVAKELALTVLLSNSIGYCDNFLSAGRSAIWDSNGALKATLESESEGILILDTITKEVTKKTISAKL